MKKINYWLEWLKSLSLELEISAGCIVVKILFVSFWIRIRKKVDWLVALVLPKYGLQLGNNIQWFHRNSLYWFYRRKNIISNMSFYVFHAAGDRPIEIDGKEEVWDEEDSNV